MGISLFLNFVIITAIMLASCSLEHIDGQQSIGGMEKITTGDSCMQDGFTGPWNEPGEASISLGGGRGMSDGSVILPREEVTITDENKAGNYCKIDIVHC